MTPRVWCDACRGETDDGSGDEIIAGPTGFRPDEQAEQHAEDEANRGDPFDFLDVTVRDEDGVLHLFTVDVDRYPIFSASRRR